MVQIDISIDDRHALARLHHQWTKTARSVVRLDAATFDRPLFETPARSGQVRYLDVSDAFVAYLKPMAASRSRCREDVAIHAEAKRKILVGLVKDLTVAQSHSAMLSVF